MPMYQTKTIASILEPVAQQVSKLIILHEEGEDGNAMPDLARPVNAVSQAVNNLTRVGKDTVNSSQDARLKADMPKSLSMIEKSANLLEMASQDLKHDPYSQAGRDQLISGSRGILQGTTTMLVSFDESQVRKICRDCKKVLDYLAVSEVIETMDDLVQFVKDLSPCLSKACQDVDARRKDLLNPYRRENLAQHLEQVKTLAPVLICAMKIYIQILDQHQATGKGSEEAVENRNYLAKRMTEEIHQIMKILEDSTREEDAPAKILPQKSESTFYEMLKQSGTSHKSVHHLVEMSRTISMSFQGQARSSIANATAELERFAGSTNNLGEPRARQQMNDLVRNLETRINEAVVSRIVEDSADVTGPLKAFTDAVRQGDRGQVDRTGQGLRAFSSRLSKTANLVAYAKARNKRQAESLQDFSEQIQSLTPQIINAGTILLNYPENRAAEENFHHLSQQFSENVKNIQEICDDSMDLRMFFQQTQARIEQCVQQGEAGIVNGNYHSLIDSTTMAAKLSNRLLAVLRRESDNSDDFNLKGKVNGAGEKLGQAIQPLIESSRAVATSGGSSSSVSGWRSTSGRLLDTVSDVTRLFDELNMYGFDSQRVNKPNQIPILLTPPSSERKAAPPSRPPLPQEVRVPSRPPMPGTGPDTDDEEGLFTDGPGQNRPIHAAAHGLYQEVRQWDHRDNEIIASAKKIAYLMAHLSELVRPGRGTKKELIACSKGLNEVAEKITELAKELARHCTDKKIRTNLLQVCEKIPTLGTQLRVLSTVKATMMGNNIDTEDDVEAMEMLVFNAQKLNEAVKETVRAAESASIRVRSDAGFKLKWIRKPVEW